MIRRRVAPSSAWLADVWGKNRKAHPLDALRALGDGPWRAASLKRPLVALTAQGPALTPNSRKAARIHA